MTLQDAYAIYVAKTHFRTLRRYLAWRVLNAANTNTRAVSPLPLRGQTGEAALSGAASPICQIDTHSPNSREI